MGFHNSYFVLLAEKIIKGFIPYDENYKNMMFNAITQGINNFIKDNIK